MADKKSSVVWDFFDVKLLDDSKGSVSCVMSTYHIYTVQYMSKLLMYDQIRIRTSLCHEISIRRIQIFLSLVTSLVLT